MTDRKIAIDVIGVHGEEFRISGPGAGREVVWLDPGFVGVVNAAFSTVWTSAADQIGGTFADAKFSARDITLPVTLLDSPLRDWETVYSRWLTAWSIWEDATLVVTTPAGRRELRCRMSETPEIYLGQLGGHVQGRAGILMKLRAGDPLFSSGVDVTGWEFNGNRWHGHVTVSNPTDVPAWPKWVCTGPASLILPDFSFETRGGFPGYEHRKRRITMPFQSYKQHVLVDTDPMVEQVVAIETEPENLVDDLAGLLRRLLPEGPQWWARMNGQFFTYPIPPRTPPTEVPVAVNPLPWLPNLWRTLQIPFSIPTDFLVLCAEAMTVVMDPLSGSRVLAMTPDDLADKIDEAVRRAGGIFGGLGEAAAEMAQTISRVLTRATIGKLVADTWAYSWGSLNTMAGAGVQVRVERKWTSAFGMELEVARDG